MTRYRSSSSPMGSIRPPDRRDALAAELPELPELPQPRIEVVPRPRTVAAALPQAPAPVVRDEDVMHAPEAASLNPRYNFETFVAGPSNQLAFAASQAAASSYRPSTTRCSSCAASGSARPTCSTRSATSSSRIVGRSHRLPVERAVHERVRPGDPHRQDCTTSGRTTGRASMSS